MAARQLSAGGPQEGDSACASSFIALVASAAGALIVGLWHGGSDTVAAHPVTAATMLAVALGLQLVTIEIYGRGSVSFSSAGMLAAGFVLGAWPAVVAGLIAGFVNLLRRRGRLDRGVFDASQFALAAGAAAVLFRIVGGGAPPTSWRSLLAACAASGAYLVINIGLLSTAMGLAEGLDPRAVWQERFRWLTPYHLAAGPLALALVIAYRHDGTIGLLVFTLPPVFMMLATRQYLARTSAAVEELRESNERIARTHLETIAALSRSMEAKDRYTGGHTERVSTLARALAQRLGYRGAELDAIEIGALLHDIGKIAVPEAILNKPGPLEPHEWEVIREHPVVSHEILSEIDLHPFVCEIARWSHERIDGAGYPDHLSGDEIPLPARIVLVADAFDALTTDRPYRRGRGVVAALQELRAHSGTQFCPQVIATLDAVFRESPAELGAAPLHVAA